MSENHAGKRAGDGYALITPAFNLPSGYVIHTVGPIIQMTPSDSQKEELASCYRNALDLAAEKGCRSIAFCCISTGVFHFPQDLAAKIAVRTVTEWLNAHPEASVDHVIFNVFKLDDLRLYRNLLYTK